MMKSEFESLAMLKGTTIPYELYTEVEKLYMTSDETKKEFVSRVYGKANSNTCTSILVKTREEIKRTLETAFYILDDTFPESTAKKMIDAYIYEHLTMNDTWNR